jgi:hypothetical protein
MDEAHMCQPGPILLLANGNLNGRVIRLVSDEVHRTHDRRVRVISATRLNPVNPWPDERSSPHAIEPDRVDWAEAEKLVRTASVFVLPPFWDGSARRLVGLARQAGTPVVYVVADIGYGARKLDAADASSLPDRICVGDPITRRLLIRNGIPTSVIRNVGSPYFDSILTCPPLPPPTGKALRVGLLANKDGMRERLSNRDEVSAEGVLPAVHRALKAFPGSRLTIRLHPRQDPARIREAFTLPESAVFDPLPPRSTLPEFISAHHLIVGSYSLGLMVARMLGRPAVSFQPPMDDDGLRREVFAAWDVPVATDEDALAARISERLQSAGRPLAPETLLYQPGGSLEAISRVILEVQSQKARPKRPRRPRMEGASSASS